MAVVPGEDGITEEQDPVVLNLPGPGQDTPALGSSRHERECSRPTGAPFLLSFCLALLGGSGAWDWTTRPT
jgi:hypothetical protein